MDEWRQRLAEPTWTTLGASTSQIQSLGVGAERAKAYYLLGHRLSSQALADGLPATSDAAIYAIVTAHALHPKAAAYTELGVLLKARGRSNEARATLELALRFTPTEPVAYRHLARLVPERAVALLRSAGALSPLDGGVQIALAGSLRSSGNLSAAQSATALAAKLAPHMKDVALLVGPADSNRASSACSAADSCLAGRSLATLELGTRPIAPAGGR